eukprot:TRINITY_DN24242_c0_g1_i1.p1 TRINITY_DN24242_c0_g1~~TRINITY_DN24242_c0_g1_i1.p1  ORF type:complete len:675 (+),score=110.46 TRINITY_DN24242_c0_g1_i1:44-2068(+)
MKRHLLFSILALATAVGGELLICVDDMECKAQSPDLRCVRFMVDGNVLGEGACKPLMKLGDVCYGDAVSVYEPQENGCPEGTVCKTADYFADYKQASDHVGDNVASHTIHMLKKVKTCQAIIEPVKNCTHSDRTIEHGKSIRVQDQTCVCYSGLVTCMNLPCEDRPICEGSEDCLSNTCVDTPNGARCTMNGQGIFPTVNGTCEERAEADDLCSADEHCGALRYCDVDTATCLMRVELGGACTPNGKPCVTGAGCTNFNSRYWSDYDPSSQLVCEVQKVAGEFCGYNGERPSTIPKPQCEAGSKCLRADGVIVEWFLTCQHTLVEPVEGPPTGKPVPVVQGICQSNADCNGDNVCDMFLNPETGSVMKEGVCGKAMKEAGDVCAGPRAVYPYLLHTCMEGTNCLVIPGAVPDLGFPTIMEFRPSVYLCTAGQAPMLPEASCFDVAHNITVLHGRSFYNVDDGNCKCYNGTFECKKLQCSNVDRGCCNQDSDCGVNEKCNEMNRNCDVLQPLGEPCDTILACEDDLWCHNSKCVDRLPGGSHCTNDGSCGVGLACRSIDQVFDESVLACKAIPDTPAPPPSPATPAPSTPAPLTWSPKTPAPLTTAPLTQEPTAIPTLAPNTPAPPQPESSKAKKAVIFLAILCSVAFIGFIVFYAFCRAKAGGGDYFVEMTPVN